MIKHGTFVYANVEPHGPVIGIILNSLRAAGKDTYLVSFHPQISGVRVVAWANQAFLNDDQFAVLDPQALASILDPQPAAPETPGLDPLLTGDE